MLLSKKKAVVILLSFLVAVFLVGLAYRHWVHNSELESRPSIAQIQVAKKELVSRTKQGEVTRAFPEFEIDKFDIVAAQKVVNEINNESGQTAESLSLILEVIDMSLAENDYELNRYALETLLHINPRANEQLRKAVNSNLSRQIVVMSFLDSEIKGFRKISFMVLAMYYEDQKLIRNLLLDATLNSSDIPGFERLDKVRVLNSIVTDDRPEIVDFLVSEVMNYKSNIHNKASPSESAFTLSQLNSRPESVLPIIIEMLEGEYFGNPGLLQAIENYGISAKAYLPRLHLLQAEVNARIKHSADQQGRGNSTFSKASYQQMLERLEAF